MKTNDNLIALESRLVELNNQLADIEEMCKVTLAKDLADPIRRPYASWNQSTLLETFCMREISGEKIEIEKTILLASFLLANRILDESILKAALSCVLTETK